MAVKYVFVTGGSGLRKRFEAAEGGLLQGDVIKTGRKRRCCKRFYGDRRL